MFKSAMFVHRAARSSYRIAIIWRNNKIIAHTVLLRSNEEQTKICFQKEANKNNDDDGDDDDETGELEYLDTIEHLNMWRPMLNKRSKTTTKKWKESSKFGCKSLRNSLLSGRAGNFAYDSPMCIGNVVFTIGTGDNAIERECTKPKQWFWHNNDQF